MSSEKNHPYHIVDLSPWPILVSFSLLFVTIGAVLMMHHHYVGMPLFALGFISLTYFSYCWWRDVIKEGSIDRAHTHEVRAGLRFGMALFILSELMLFAAIFGSFFKAWLDPVHLLEGPWVIAPGTWPGKHIHTLDPWEIPFLNTLILLLSGTTVTWAHYALTENKQKEVVEALGYTVFLGAAFSLFQAYEYWHAPFKMRDGIYPSNFYLATGFHGMHVIIGTIFLAVCYFRAKRGDFEKGNGHLGFEFAAWYWHFVDVIWLFLFIFVYILGGQ